MASADNSSSERMDTPPSEGTMATGAIPEDGLTRSVFKNGYYENPWPTWKRINWANVLKFFFWEKNNSDVPKKEVLNEELPICTPDFGGYEKSPLTGVRTMWVGHATVLVQFDNVTILTDPVFSNRCSPSQWFGPKRYRKPPCKVEDLPKVDAVVISHNHYDHLDYYSVVALNKKFGASLRWYVPMGLKEWMVSTGCQNVQELDWWQEAEHATADGTSVKFVCTPCQHWSKRTPTDDFRRLYVSLPLGKGSEIVRRTQAWSHVWCDCVPADCIRTLWSSWSVIGPKHRFFFGGDTGYCEVFKQIGHKYGPFSLAAIPIGAYEPRWFMHPQHVNPKESVQIHEDVQSRMSVGIHWGTFTLTNEPILEPREKLKEELKQKNLDLAEFITLHHGEVTVLAEDAYQKVD